MVPWDNPSQPPPNASSIGSAVFAGLDHERDQHTHTHRQTDHATPSVALSLQCGRKRILHDTLAHTQWQYTTADNEKKHDQFFTARQVSELKYLAKNYVAKSSTMCHDWQDELSQRWPRVSYDCKTASRYENINVHVICAANFRRCSIRRISSHRYTVRWTHCMRTTFCRACPLNWVGPYRSHSRIKIVENPTMK